MLEYVDLDVLVPGVYDATPDRQAILGPLPGLDGLYVAAGFSGHGFMLAPATGRALAGAGSPATTTGAAASLDARSVRRGPARSGAGDRLMFLQLLANGLVTGSVIAIAAVGVSLVYGILRLVNFAYGDFMAFGAFLAFLFDVTWHLPIVVSALLAMVATAALSVLLELVLWRPLRRRQAGFMSLFLASIGLALVLRQSIFLAWGPQPRQYRIDPYKVYVIGSVRLSGAQGVAIVVAAVAIVLVALAARKDRASGARCVRWPTTARSPRSPVSTRDRIVIATWVIAGALAALAGVLAGLIQTSFDPNFGFQLLLPVFAAVVLGGIGSAYGALARRPRARARDGALDLERLRRRRQPRLQAGRRLQPADRRAARPPAGPLREGENNVSTIASGDFWAFVGVVAGIYTILALGLQLQFGFTGLLNFGQVAFMAIGAYAMAILVVKEGMSMWLAAFLGDVAAGMLAGAASSACRRCACAPTTSRSSRSRSARSSATSRRTRTA